MAPRPGPQDIAGLAATGLQVYLLGPPRLEWNDRPLAIPRRQVRALLYRLAACLEAVPREHLCFLFWPDAADSIARRHLSHLLTHLRRALPAPEALVVTEDHVGLDAGQVWSDTAAFVHLCDMQAANRSVRALQQAADLYAGPFLTGFSLPGSPEFEAWAAQERRIFERRSLDALAALVEAWAAREAYDKAVACARRYLEVDDLAEEMHRRLIALYAASGDRSAALRQFERCVAALERELGVSPLPETWAVYQAILAGRPPPRESTPAAHAWTTLPGLDVPLVGRDGALRQLEQAYARARAGQGGIILIAGEAGIGKSRLIQEFAARLQPRTLVLAGGGHPHERALPYQPIVQAIRTVPLPLPPSLSPVWLAEVSRLLPELRAMHPDLPPPLPTETEDARTRLFEALCRITLGLAAGPQPVLLCLDDLHWTDETTLNWLAYLGRHIHTSAGGAGDRHRILVIGTYRSEEAGAVGELRPGLARLGILSEVRLAGLDAEAVLQLVRHLLGSRPGDQALAARLRQATGGNPFFLLETLRTLAESGRLRGDVAHLREFPLPDTVREAVQARLHHLSPVARQVLEAGAIFGRTFGFDLVRLTAGRRELEIMDGLDELVARQLLVEQPPGYCFHHDLTQRAVEAGLSPMRRQLLHRRAGQALEHLEPDAVVALANHFDAGGEPQKALWYHGQAAARAEGVSAWREAEQHQGRMLELLDRLDPNCAQREYVTRRGRVLAARAHLRFLQGRLAERDTDLAALTSLAEASGDEELRLQALAHQVRYLNLDGRYAEAIAAAEEGLALTDRLHDVAARSRFLAQIGFARYFLGQPQPALDALETALALAGDEADAETRGRITHILGYVHLHLANYAQALACQQEAYACHRAVGDSNRMAWDLTDMGILHTRLNHLQDAERYLDEALALARKIGSQPAESYALNNLGTLHFVRGNYPAALKCHKESLVLQRATGSRRGEASALANVGVVRLALGDGEAAESLLRQAMSIQAEIGYESGRAEGLAHLARALAGQGRLDEALPEARCSLAVARRIGDRAGQVVALNVLAQLQLSGRAPVAVLPTAGEAVTLAEEIGLVGGHILGLTILGLGHLALGDLDRAHRHTARAVALLREQDCIDGPEEAVLLAHGRVLATLGRRAEAAETLCQARAEVRAKAARILDPELRRRYLRSWRTSSFPAL